MSFRRSRIPKFIPILSLLILLVLGPIVFSLLQNASGVEAAWVDDNFSYRNAIPITSHTAAENNVYVTATIDTSASGQFQSDCGDLRFTTVGGDILPYYIVSGCVSASTVVHVFFKSMPAGAQTLYYYYGNPSAANGFSSADFATQATAYAVGSIASQEKGGAPIAYWKFDEGTGTNTQDSSQNNNDGTITGATWQTEDQCISGKCLFFDGSTSNVAAANLANTTFPSSGTISFWSNLSRWSATDNLFGSQTGASNVNSIRLEWVTGNKYRPIFGNAAGSYDSMDSYTAAVTNAWTYITLTWDQNSSGTIKLYLNGKLDQSKTSMATYYPTVFPSLNIGRGYSGRYSKGFIDDFKIYSYARTAAQIKSDFKSRGTAKGTSVSLSSRAGVEGSLSNGLVGYWKMDEVSGAGSTLADSSGNSNTGTAVLWGGGNTSTDSAHVAGKFGNSFSFDGGDDAITIPDATSLRFTSTTGVSVSAWVKMNATNQNDDIVSKMSGNNGIQLRRNSSGKFTWAIGNGTTTATSTNTTSLSTGTWYHVTGTFDRNTLYVYVNGVQEGSNTISGFSDDTAQLVIGNENQLSNNAYWDGTIDEVRIYNRALSPREARDLYNWAPGPVGYWNFDEKNGQAANDTSGNGKNGTLGANSSPGTDDPAWTSGKYGAALNFDGSNDYVPAGASTDYEITDEMTIEFWMNPRAHTTNYVRPISKGGYLDNGWTIYTDVVGTNKLYPTFGLNSGGGWSGSFAPSITYQLNQWQHVAVTVKLGSIGKSYINGVFLGSSTPATYYPTTTRTLRIGSEGGSFFNGMIDDVRIYNYVRTQKQIVEDMNAGHPVGGSPVGSQVGYWKFDEGYGATAYDSSPQGNNASLWGGTSGTADSGSNTTTMVESSEWWAKRYGQVDGSYNGWYIYSGGQTRQITGSTRTGTADNYVITLTWGSAISGFTTGSSYTIYNDDTNGPDKSNEGKFNKSLFFDGEDDWVEVPASTSIKPYQNNFTLSLWIKPSDISRSQTVLVKRPQAGCGEYSLSTTSTNVTFDAILNTGSGCFDSLVSTGVALTNNQWNHIAVTYDHVNQKIYLNGVLKGTTAQTTEWQNDSSHLVIGTERGYAPETGNWFKGYLDEVKIYNSALTEDEIKLDYNRGQAMVLGNTGDASSSAGAIYCQPGSSDTCNPPVGEWNFNENGGASTYDTSGNGNTCTLTNSPTWVMGKVGTAIQYVNPTNNYLDCGNNSSLTLGTNDFTISTWLYPTFWESNKEYAFVYRTKDAGSDNGYEFELNTWSQATDKYVIGGYTLDTTAPGYRTMGTSSFTISKNTWSHITIVRQGTSITWYLNGIKYNTSTNAGTGTNFNPATNFMIGKTAWGSTQQFQGTIDQVRVFNYARSAAQIALDYNQGKPVGHWKLDECQGVSVFDSSGNNNTGTITIGATGTQTAVGTCTTSGTAWYNGVTGKFNSSLNFDGTDDYVDVTTESNFDFTDAITISAWIKEPTGSSSRSIVAKSGYGSDSFRFMHNWDNTFTFEVNSQDLATTNTYTETSWRHVVASYDKQNMKIYVNGILDGSVSYSTAISTNNNNLRFGITPVSNTYLFSGQIDDVRIYNYVLTPLQVKTLYNGSSAIRFGPQTGSP